MLFTAHGVGWDGEEEGLALRGHLQLKVVFQGAAPFRSPFPRDRWSGLNLVGQTLYSAVSGVWRHGGPGPYLLLPASWHSGQQRAPRENGGRGCGCALGLMRNSVLEPQTGWLDLISLAPEWWSRALMPPAALAT